MHPARCSVLIRHCLPKGNVRFRRHQNILLLTVLIAFIFYTLLMDLSYPYGELDLDLPADEWSREDPSDWSHSSSFCDIYEMTSPYKADFECVATQSVPPVFACLFEFWRDMYISHDIRSTGLWEWHILKDIQTVLRRDPDLGFIDVGANIGFYSLIAAKMGHKTVAVEPFLESVYRLHKAALLTGVQDKIIIVRNAVADIRLEGTVRASGDNQGDTRVVMESKPCIGSCPPTVNTILLNDLLEVTNFSRAIIKVDIQGFEHKALVHADKLLDAVQIPYIFMEWLMMKEYWVSANHTSSDKYTVEEMLQSLFSRNYRPFQVSYNGGGPLDPKKWNTWPHDIVWHKLPGPEEYGQLMRSHFMQWPS